MINLVREKNPMPEQAPEVRNKNFLEVAEGYTEDMAVREAMRCLKCRKKPCMSGCPVMVRIPDFARKEAASLAPVKSSATQPISNLSLIFLHFLYPFFPLLTQQIRKQQRDLWYVGYQQKYNKQSQNNRNDIFERIFDGQL